MIRSLHAIHQRQQPTLVILMTNSGKIFLFFLQCNYCNCTSYTTLEEFTPSIVCITGHSTHIASKITFFKALVDLDYQKKIFFPNKTENKSLSNLRSIFTLMTKSLKSEYLMTPSSLTTFWTALHR